MRATLVRRSGQINFEKSSIQFGHKIEKPIRQELHDILGIHNLGGIRSYLGIPENLGGSKPQVFGYWNWLETRCCSFQFSRSD
ncbi:unnamed protein product [Brassica oleracea]